MTAGVFATIVLLTLLLHGCDVGFAKTRGKVAMKRMDSGAITGSGLRQRAPNGTLVSSWLLQPNELMKGMSLYCNKVSVHEIEIKLRLEKYTPTWIAIGISSSCDLSMTNSGNGVDVVFCAAGQAARSFITARRMLRFEDIFSMPEAICSQVRGISTLMFRRNITTQNPWQHSISPGRKQSVVFAYGREDERHPTYHGLRRGAKHFDFAKLCELSPSDYNNSDANLSSTDVNRTSIDSNGNR